MGEKIDIKEEISKALPSLSTEQYRQHDFMLAILNKNFAKVNSYLKAIKADKSGNLNVNTPESTLGITPLMTAAVISTQMLRNLLDSGNVDIDASNVYGDTALSEACAAGKLKSATLLVKSGANVNNAAKYGETPLYIACSCSESENLDVVKYLLTVGGINVNAADVNGRTALHMACKYGNAAIVEQLVKTKGIDVNRPDKNGITPIMMANRDKSSGTSIIKTLLKNGASYPERGGAKHTLELTERKKNNTWLSQVSSEVTSGSNINQI